MDNPSVSCNVGRFRIVRLRYRVSVIVARSVGISVRGSITSFLKRHVRRNLKLVVA